MFTGIGNNISEAVGLLNIKVKIKPLIMASFPKYALARPPELA
jgi:hypothetical protein